MAGKNLATIRSEVRQFLLDEFVVDSDTDFQDDELNMIIRDTLVEISEVSPRMVKEELTTTSGSREIDISDIEDLLEIEEVEYRTGYTPVQFRNFSVREAGVLTLEIDFLPGDSEDVYLYCRKTHQLTRNSTTLNPQQERVLVEGAVAKAANNWLGKIRGHIDAAAAAIANINSAVDNMTLRITQATTDLTNARTYIDKLNTRGKPQSDLMTAAYRELQVASDGYLTQSQGYLRELQADLSITNTIRTYQNWATNQLALYKRDLGKIRRRRYQKLYARN